MVNAYRKDLADIALASQVLASHYAEPVTRTIAADTGLKTAPAREADEVRPLRAGESFELLEESLGWGWGFAASDHRVGYVSADALVPAS